MVLGLVRVGIKKITTKRTCWHPLQGMERNHLWTRKDFTHSLKIGILILRPKVKHALSIKIILKIIFPHLFIIGKK